MTSDTKIGDMKISVVMPCWNAAGTLSDQLSALEGQTLPPFEVIIADNGSTDGTRLVASAFAERLPRFQIIDASTVRGAAHARNAGAGHASGTHLAFCDADDIMSPIWLEAIAAAFERSDFVASRFDNRTLNAKVTSSAQESELQSFRTPFLPFAGGSGLAIRKSLHDQVGGFDESLMALEDADYCIRVQFAGPSLILAEDAVVQIRSPRGSAAGFIAARKATYKKAHAWSYNMTELYLRYRNDGMELHGVAIRLVLLVPLVAKFVISGAKNQPLWRIGWHAGAIHRLIEDRWQRLTHRPKRGAARPKRAAA